MIKLLPLVALLLLTPVTHAQTLKLLFLGDKGHHEPRVRFQQLQPVMKLRGIDLTYTDQLKDLNPTTLKEYAGLIVYANIDVIGKDQAEALLSFVKEGKGFIPLHCASYCFRNNEDVVKLIGGQFKSHGTGTFRALQAQVDHPILKGFKSFESWDETYVHTKHNEENRTVLEFRLEKDDYEPWTWVRTHGKGRVFYTAWGHDERTWAHPGFQNLVERGIRWACNADLSKVPEYTDGPKMTPKRKDVEPFEYIPAKVPFYPPSKTWGVTTEPLPTMQKPLSPEESLKHYVTPVGFEMKLFASEPLIQGKPICMNSDEQGRLWLVETLDYPNEKKPEGQGRDRIVILEDTDGDGVADKRTVFVEGLSIPTSIAFAHGGVIVHQAPHTLFFKNINDKAGPKQILFTGWGTQDTHAGPSNLQYGLDGWYYGAVGYSGFNGEVNGERLRFGQGFYRFKLDPVPLSPGGRGVRGEGEPTVTVSKLEFLASTNNNTWGLGFSEEGILFGSTANGNPSVCMPIPNRYYEKVKGWSASVLPSISGNAEMHPITDKVRQVDYHGHFTAAAGHALYTARLYPKEYWNKTAFVCEPTGHLVACFQLTPDGASFRSRNAWNLVASDDEWAAPIMAEIGPDSCVWILDWYNYIVQHNPTPAGFKTGKGAAYETELRDKKHGRVYRLVPKDKPLPAKVNLKGATPEKLVETLKNDNFFWRRQAQRLLVENGPKKYDEMLQILDALIKQERKDQIGFDVAHIHAHQIILQMMETVVLDEKLIPKRQPISQSEYQSILGKFLEFADGQEKWNVGNKLTAYLAVPAILRDRWLRDALTVASATNSGMYLDSLSQHKSPITDDEAIKIVRIAAGHFARSGKFDFLSRILKNLPTADPTIATPILQAWATAWPNTPLKLDDEDKKNLTALITKAPKEARSQVIKLGMIWDAQLTAKYAQQMKGELLELLTNSKTTDDVRLTTARDLVALLPDDGSVVEKIVASITPRLDKQTTVSLLQTLAESKSKNLGEALLKRLSEFTPTARTETFKLLLRKPDSTRALLGAIEKNQLALTELSLEQRQSLANHPDATIASKAKEILERGGSLPSADRQKVIDEWMFTTKKTGDAPAGKLMFTKHCAKCHMLGGEGKHIGPDLTGMAVHPKSELIVHILDPHRSVEGNFRSYTVVLNDGKVLNGMMAGESKTSIEIIDVEGKTTAIQRDDIDQLVVTNKSLMPEGFEKQMNDVEFTNLLEFLTQKGKYIPLPLDKVATISTAKGMFFADEGTVERLIFPDWKPKTFQGIPFLLIDPQGGKINNAVMLYGPQGTKAPTMPKSVSITCAAPVKALHFLSGISGWGYPASTRQSTSMTVRLKYADGTVEEHALKNGVHFADYIRRVDVPESKFAFDLNGRQVRYFAVSPKRSEPIAAIELVKGGDQTAPVVMAVTAELR